jgi:hypothetical protein
MPDNGQYAILSTNSFRYREWGTRHGARKRDYNLWDEISTSTSWQTARKLCEPSTTCSRSKCCVVRSTAVKAYCDSYRMRDMSQAQTQGNKCPLNIYSHIVERQLLIGSGVQWLATTMQSLHCQGPGVHISRASESVIKANTSRA